jgi:hemoglobin
MRRIFLVIAIVGLAAACSQPGETTDTPVAQQAARSESITPVNYSVDEQIQSLEEGCSTTAEARSTRHAETPLYERLGGDEKIHALTQEIVRLHLLNDGIKHFFTGLDTDMVATQVADFVITGTGGPDIYTGRDLKTSHERLALTNADFMAAGGDVIQAMKNLDYREEEIDEVVCILVSLRDQVIFAE